MATLAVTCSMASLPSGIGPIDPPALALVSLLLTIVALLVCWIPARQVMTVDPLVAPPHEY